MGMLLSRICSPLRISLLRPLLRQAKRGARVRQLPKAIPLPERKRRLIILRGQEHLANQIIKQLWKGSAHELEVRKRSKYPLRLGVKTFVEQTLWVRIPKPAHLRSFRSIVQLLPAIYRNANRMLHEI